MFLRGGSPCIMWTTIVCFLSSCLPHLFVCAYVNLIPYIYSIILKTLDWHINVGCQNKDNLMLFNDDLVIYRFLYNKKSNWYLQLERNHPSEGENFYEFKLFTQNWILFYCYDILFISWCFTITVPEYMNNYSYSKIITHWFYLGYYFLIIISYLYVLSHRKNWRNIHITEPNAYILIKRKLTTDTTTQGCKEAPLKIGK